MQFFVSPIRAIAMIFALLVAASAVSAMPQPIDVVARNSRHFQRYNWLSSDMPFSWAAVASLNHDENNMLKRQENNMLKRQENDMLKRQETSML